MEERDGSAFMYISRDGKLLLTCGNNRYECSFKNVNTFTLKGTDKVMGFQMSIDDDNYIYVYNSGSWSMINIETVCPYMNFNDCLNKDEIDEIISLIESKSFFRKTSTPTITRVTCSGCNGSGKQSCSTCSGAGKLRCTCCNGTGIYTYIYSQLCTCCMGTGGINCSGCYGLGWKSCGQCYGSGYVSSTSSSSNSSSYTTQQTTASSAKIEKVWVEHNMYQNGQKGMRIHIKFSVDNMLGRQGSVTAWFYYDNGSKLILTAHNGAYTTPDKQVAVADRFTPTYTNTIYNDFVLFFPNNAIPNLGRGTHNLKFKVGIVNGGVEIATSEFQSFTMSW
jgi:hypothetical protein